MTGLVERISRLELKYLVNRAQADAIKEYVRGFCSPDVHCEPGTNGYVVNNLYLDTPDLRFYRDVKNRKLTRFKTRVRYYGNQSPESIWLELKNRQANVVWKVRRMIAADMWPGVLQAREAPSCSPGMSGGKATFEEVAQFFGVRPLLHVRYFREPWVSDLDHYGRVTLDTRLTFRLALGSYDLECNDGDMTYYDDPVTIGAADSLWLLEVKVEKLVPQWAIRMIRTFGLEQRGFSKYCYAVDRTLEGQGPPSRQARYAPR